ncbi:MAG: hypothetical protein WC222_02155 [Parachlamydiales bacterium]|jgi:hypothetical protein
MGETQRSSTESTQHLWGSNINSETTESKQTEDPRMSRILDQAIDNFYQLATPRPTSGKVTQQTSDPQTERIAHVASPLTPRGKAIEESVNVAVRNEEFFGKSMDGMTKILNLCANDVEKNKDGMKNKLADFNKRQIAKNPNFKPFTSQEFRMVGSNFAAAATLSKELSSKLENAKTPQDKVLVLRDRETTAYNGILHGAELSKERSNVMMEFLNERKRVGEFVSKNSLPPAGTMLRAPRAHLESHVKTLNHLSSVSEGNDAAILKLAANDMSKELGELDDAKTERESKLNQYNDKINTQKDKLDSARSEGKTIEDLLSRPITLPDIPELDDTDDNTPFDFKTILSFEEGTPTVNDTPKPDTGKSVEADLKKSAVELESKGMGKKTWESFKDNLDKLYEKGNINNLPNDVKKDISKGFLANLKILGKKENSGFFGRLGLIAMRATHGIFKSDRKNFEASVNHQVNFIKTNNPSLSAAEMKILNEAEITRDKILGRR